MTDAPAPPKNRPRKAARGDAQSDSPQLRTRSPASAGRVARAPHGSAPHDSAPDRPQAPLGSAPHDAPARHGRPSHGGAPEAHASHGAEDKTPRSPAPEDEKRARIDELRARIQHITTPGHVARRHLTRGDDDTPRRGDERWPNANAPHDDALPRRGAAQRRPSRDDSNDDVRNPSDAATHHVRGDDDVGHPSAAAPHHARHQSTAAHHTRDDQVRHPSAAATHPTRDDDTKTFVDVDAPRGHARRSGGRRGDTSTDDAGSAKPPPDRTSPAALEQAALRYLNRYDASVEQLRRVLFRHAERHAEGAALARARDDVRALLERYQTSRILDDGRYAEALGRGLRARGASAALIRQKLRARGVAAELVEGALERLAAHDEGTDPELAAAKNYVRRKRLTKRHDITTREGRQKALAALARQGFSFGVASAALAAALDEAESTG